jgi:hypothetical protein
MQRFLVLFGLFITTQNLPAPIIESEAPILQYFSAALIANPDHPGASALKVDFKNPLLTITSFSSLTVHADGKGVTVVLNEGDVKKFAELTRKFTGQLLFCKATDKVGGIAKIIGPTEDGVIVFSEARYSGNIAEYLRKRFGK